MMIKELPSPKLCKDCGKPAYSFVIGWTDNEGVEHWHQPKHFNQCKECRALTYKKITEKRKNKLEEEKAK